MKRLLALAVLVGLGAAWYLALPPRVEPPQTPVNGDVVRGAIHVHSNRSDGTASVEDVAAAAARAGLDFVVFTDHGDATRRPDPPRYLSGVLCIDAVEISTYGGHIVALGLPEAPYPFGGETRDVIDDIVRLGGLAIAAHPASLKPELRWSDWSLPIAGLEWLNGDSEWRDESWLTLGRALVSYPARQTETLAWLLDRPDGLLRQWDVLTQQRRIVAVAGSDAHARVGFRSLGEPYDNGSSLHIPSYEQVFRVFSNILPGIALAGDPAADAALVVGAVRDGHVYTRVDGIAAGGTMSFTAQSGHMRASAGDVLPAASPAVLEVDLQAAPAARIDLLKDGAVVASGPGPRLTHSADASGVYRVEISLPAAPGQPPVPWMLSNPIYIGAVKDATQPAAAPRPAAVAVRYANGPATDWAMETSPASRAALDVVPAANGTELALRYALGGAASASPFAAFVLRAGDDLPKYDRIVFTARADDPMRLSVQLRAPAGPEGERWQRSVVLDRMPREITVRFDDLRPAGATSSDRPRLADVDSILFVVDTINTPLGGAGRIWIDEVKYAR